MDPLTHALTGAALAHALPVPELKRRGLLFSMIMSAAPDFDVLPAFVANLPGNLIPGELLFDPHWMHLHRGVTHSLFFAFVFGAVAGWIFWRIGIRKGAAWIWPAFTVLVLLVHVLFDLLNAGVMLWSPFSDAWVSFADLPVVDPFLLVPLLGCSFATVSSTGQRWGARRIARYCLLFIGIVIALRCCAEAAL